MRTRKTKPTKQKKAKGKSVSKNRQLTAFLKEKGSLSYKLDGTTYEMKIPDTIIEKIDKILEKEFKEQVETKNILMKKLKPHKDDINELNKFYKDNGYDKYERRHTIQLLDEIEKLETAELEKFNKKNIKNMEKKVYKLIDDIQSFLSANINDLYLDDTGSHLDEIDLIEEILDRSHNQ